MKKTFNAPEIVELDFKETNAICGVGGKRVKYMSGPITLDTSGDCFNVKGYFNLRFGAAFDDNDEENYDEE